MNEDKKIRRASHIPLLTRVIDISEGDIMEIGTGTYSTPLLHWLAHLYQRNLYSYENNQDWFKEASKENSNYHKIILISNWDSLPEKPPSGDRWGVIFVDHSPGERRLTEIKRFADKADFIVVHDTQPQDNEEFYTQVLESWKLFKYRYDWTKALPWTSVVSNYKDLKNI